MTDNQRDRKMTIRSIFTISTLMLIPLVLWAGLLLSDMNGFGSTQNSTQKTTIQLSTWGSQEEITVLKALLKKFEAQHPTIHVELLYIPDNYGQKLHLLAAAGKLPDVVFINSLAFPVYAQNGLFADLRPFLAGQAKSLAKSSEALKLSDFFPQSLEAFRLSGSIQGALPRDVSNLVVFYNRDLFKHAGLADPKPDWTWAEFLKTAQTLTRDANHDDRPEQFGMSFYRKPSLFWLPFVYSAGGQVLLGNKQWGLNSPEALKGLQFYRDLAMRYHVAPRQTETGSTTMTQLFVQQKIAMMLYGRWGVPLLRQQAKFDWDVAPFPRGPAGSKVGIDASGYAISAKTRYPQASWQLLCFLLSSEALQAFSQSGLIIPARRDVAASEAFLSPTQRPHHSRVFLEVIPTGIPTPAIARSDELEEVVQLALEPVWNGEKSPEDALKTIISMANRLLSQ